MFAKKGIFDNTNDQTVHFYYIQLFLQLINLLSHQVLSHYSFLNLSKWNRQYMRQDFSKMSLKIFILKINDDPFWSGRKSETRIWRDPQLCAPAMPSSPLCGKCLTTWFMDDPKSTDSTNFNKIRKKDKANNV